MTQRFNPETANDPHPMEQNISIEVGGTVFKFVVIVPRYVWWKLTQEDWVEAAKQLRQERDRHVSDSLRAGLYFTVEGQQAVRERIRQSMCDLIYERFTQLQIQAGEEAWAVPSTLQRAS